MAQEHAGVEREVRSDNDNRKPRTEAPPQAAPPQKREPTRRERWDAYRPSKLTAFWLCVASVALTLIVGFTWGGWVTSGSAQQSATTLAKSAVTLRLVPICVEQFNRDPDRDAKLTELRAVSSYQQKTYVTDQGWATMPGDEKADGTVADQCARALLAMASQ
jgi:hypothetical protein